MLTAKDIMTSPAITVGPGTEIIQAARLLLEKSINGVPVVDGTGRVVGILCQSDLVAQQKKIPIPSVFTTLDGFFPLASFKKVERELAKMAAVRVGDAMTRDVVCVGLDTSIEDIATLMVDKNYHTLPVLDGGKLAGVVGKEDVLRTVAT
jgi:CBS domain-containing protein